MIARPCNISARCNPCAEDSSPYENLSAEAPDPINYIATVFVGPIIPCENGGCTPDPCVGSCVVPPIPPVCPWCITNGTGKGSGDTPEKAVINGTNNTQQQINDAQGKPTFWNSAYGGNIPCPGGSSSQYTIPAGTYSGNSQAEADALAQSNFDQLAYANLICITTDTLPGVCASETDYNQTLAAYGGITIELGHYVWEVSAGSLPPGFALDAISGLVNGNPNSSVPGSYTFTVTVSDDLSNNASKDFTITIVGIDQTTLPSGTDGPYGPGSGTAYSQQLTINSGADTATWALTSGTLPDGVTLGTDGLISGTPESGSKGTYSFSVSATLGNQTCTQSFSLRIWGYLSPSYQGERNYGNTEVGTVQTITGVLAEGRYDLTLGTPSYVGGASTSVGGINLLSANPGGTSRYLFGTAPGFTMSFIRPGEADYDMALGDTGNGCNICDAACYNAAVAAKWAANPILTFEVGPAGIASTSVKGIFAGAVCFNTGHVGEAFTTSAVLYRIYKTGIP